MVDRKSRERNSSGTDSGTQPADKKDSTKKGPAASTTPNGRNSDANDTGEADAGNDSSNEEVDSKLIKSPRFPGYLTMFLSSIINYHGVSVSESTTDKYVIASTGVQRQYGYAVAMISCVTSGLCVVCLLDRCSCFANVWKNKLFAPKSKFETILVVMLLLWWFMAVVIQTRCAGIAGDGKGQHNIYFSTWFCFFCAISVVESKMMEHDWPSIKKFIKSWPNRAPGWIAILVSNFFTLWWYVDVYITYDTSLGGKEGLNPNLVSYYGNINNIQYDLLIFVSAATLLPSTAFVFMEIFRDSSENKKGTVETYIEAFCLFVLACGWVPGVCVATTPGGFAAQIGNSWFFTWATCFLVMETLLWFVSDSRGGLRQTLMEKEEEYAQHQQNVLATAHGMLEETNSSILHQIDSDVEQNADDDDDEIMLQDPPDMPKKSVESLAAFEIKDGSDNDDSVDSIQQEMRMKKTNPRAYFEGLDDILE